MPEPLLDHLIGECEQCGWHFDAERPRRLQVDNELKLGRLHETSVARSRIHSSSVIGLSEMMYLPSTCSICCASRQSAGFLFLSQKMHAVTSGRTRSRYGTLVTSSRPQ